MTHRYTLLVGGTIFPGPAEPRVSALAWAGDTVLALGTDEEVRAVSRGDSHVVELDGAVVVPLAPGPNVRWPADATLEVGGRADLAVLPGDPGLLDRDPERPLRAVAIVRGGRLVAGTLPGADHDGMPHGHE